MSHKISAFMITALILFLGACGGGGDESNAGGDNNPVPEACQSEKCVNLANAQEININDNEKTSELLGGETIGVKFNATVGGEYKVHVVSNVSYSIYITNSSTLVPSQALVSGWDNGGHRSYDFQAKNTGEHYIVVELEESTGKVEVSARVTSRTENLSALTGTTPLKINALRTEFSLVPGASMRWYFDVKQGNTYKIHSAQIKGAIKVRSSVIPSVDTYEYDARPDANGKISFQAKVNGRIFVAAVDNGSGSDGNIRVYSYDEPAPPIGTETVLVPNATPLEFDINPKQYKRFFFVSRTGKDYNVSVKRVSGNIGTWLSVLPTVDSDVYEKRKTYCNTCSITWREAESKRWFLAVGNSSDTTAGKFTVQVIEN